MELPPELAAKLLARQNEIEPCVARLKKAITHPEQINTIVHELRSYQRELEDEERKEEIAELTAGMNKSRLLVEEVNYDPETRQRIIRVIEHFCPMHKGRASADRWIQYHQLSAGIIDNCPPRVAGETPGALLKYSRKPDMVKVWKDRGSALFTTKHEMGIPKRTRGLLTFTLDELDYAEELMERDIIEREEQQALKTAKKQKKKKKAAQEEGPLELTDLQQLMDDAMDAILAPPRTAPAPAFLPVAEPVPTGTDTEVDAAPKPAAKRGRPRKKVPEPESEAEEDDEEEAEEEEEDATRSRSQRSTRGTKTTSRKRAASAGRSPARKRTRAASRAGKSTSSTRRSARNA